MLVLSSPPTTILHLLKALYSLTWPHECVWMTVVCNSTLGYGKGTANSCLTNCQSTFRDFAHFSAIEAVIKFVLFE